MSSDGEAAPHKPDLLEGLEARLHANSKAFESLLALTPARDYYGSQIVDGRDPSEQWNRKKQTKDEKRAAKKAKLDPANNKSALDVLKEREEQVKAKRKREADGDGFDDDHETQAIGKKRKVEVNGSDEEAKRREKAEKKKERRLRRKEKTEKKRAKAEAKKAKKQDDDLAEAETERGVSDQLDEQADDLDSDNEAEPFAHPADMEDFDMSGLADDDQEAADELNENMSELSSVPTTPIVESPAFDVATNHSAASSSSSISLHSTTDQLPALSEPRRPQLAISTDAPTTTPTPTISTIDTSSVSKSKDITSGTSSPKLQLPDIDAEELRARFNKRYQELRAARKADGPDGKPIKSRQDIMEQRRKKAEQRKATKKAQRQKAKEEEARKREEQLRGSGSPLSRVGDVFSPPPPRQNNYSFSRLSFGDSAGGSVTLDSLNDPSDSVNTKKKQKGPSDPKTALQAAQARDTKLANLPAHKQALQSQNRMWNNAASRAHGERPRDDTSLLKKALKRKEKQKGKSEKEWKEREQGVVKAREAAQQKRERNLQKRREEKGGKGKGTKKKGGKVGPAKKKGRPGFEGRWKA